MFLPVSFPTKSDVTLIHSKYSPTTLCLPCLVRVSDLSVNERNNAFKLVTEMGAVTLFSHPFLSDETVEILDETYAEYELEVKTNYNAHHIFIKLWFNNSGVLRAFLTTNKHDSQDIRTVYDYALFKEIVLNLESTFPLVTE